MKMRDVAVRLLWLVAFVFAIGVSIGGVEFFAHVYRAAFALGAGCILAEVLWHPVGKILVDRDKVTDPLWERSLRLLAILTIVGVLATGVAVAGHTFRRPGWMSSWTRCATPSALEATSSSSMSRPEGRSFRARSMGRCILLEEHAFTLIASKTLGISLNLKSFFRRVSIQRRASRRPTTSSPHSALLPGSSSKAHISTFSRNRMPDKAIAPTDQTRVRAKVRALGRGRSRRMKKSSVAYPFEVRPLSKEEGGGYSIYFPDLPGCWSDGTTPEHAIENGRDALQSWLAVAQEFGDGIPKPFSSVSGRFVQRVPRSLHARLIARAKAEGVSLNTLVVSLVSQGIGKQQAAERADRRLTTRSTRTRARTARAG
jgi:antitoxin HicB